MADNAWKLGGLTLPNPIVMAENMLSDGALFSNENHATDNFGGVKFKGGQLKDNWAFLGSKSTGFMGKAASDSDAHSGASASATTARPGTGTATSAGGPTAQATRGAAQRGAVSGGGWQVVKKSPTQSPTQSPMQSPTQSPVQSPIQGPPQKSTPAQKPDQVKRGLQNPLAIPVGIADGLIDFITHCVGAHVEFLWKDPLSILRDPVAAIKLNQLEINPLGHIFKSIESANQMDNPVKQLFEIPMGMESLPLINKTAAGKAAAAKMAANDDHNHAPGQKPHG